MIENQKYLGDKRKKKKKKKRKDKMERKTTDTSEKHGSWNFLKFRTLIELTLLSFISLPNQFWFASFYSTEGVYGNYFPPKPAISSNYYLFWIL